MALDRPGWRFMLTFKDPIYRVEKSYSHWGGSITLLALDNLNIFSDFNLHKDLKFEMNQRFPCGYPISSLLGVAVTKSKCVQIPYSSVYLCMNHSPPKIPFIWRY